jgi:hypothetical protein
MRVRVGDARALADDAPVCNGDYGNLPRGLPCASLFPEGIVIAKKVPEPQYNHSSHKGAYNLLRNAMLLHV